MAYRGLRQWSVVPVVSLVSLVVAGCLVAGCSASGGTTTSPDGRASGSAGAAPGRQGQASPSSNASANDPARHAAKVVKRASQAGVSAQLLMAILYNESYKPHDPELERQWQRMKPDAAFGVANMHKATFDEVKQGRDFAGRSWDELPDDPDLAIEAAAWYLHDLAAQLPAGSHGSYTKEELLALGYNAGPGNMRAFAKGAKPGAMAQSYLDRLRGNWDKARQAVRS
ncbi:transglycosylase SLT domain-containing protein [Streptomyces sp. NPDC008001]|uniref:transglycosylase SLT domain-containing protein n=1 Tax=Streptomyces sp. NPDC008001 TaxID=3364804 RepID=UPI0036E503D6